MKVRTRTILPHLKYVNRHVGTWSTCCEFLCRNNAFPPYPRTECMRNLSKIAFFRRTIYRISSCILNTCVGNHDNENKRQPRNALRCVALSCALLLILVTVARALSRPLIRNWDAARPTVGCIYKAGRGDSLGKQQGAISAKTCQYLCCYYETWNTTNERILYLWWVDAKNVLSCSQ